LGKDPETRTTPNGKKVCHFSVAVSQQWRSAEGGTRKATDWFNVEAWGRLGEICQEHLSKGRLVYLDGRLKVDQYEKEGEKRTATKVVALSMQMLDRKPEEEEPVSPLPEEEEFPSD
jgi:single-strand DNA-binding protein